MGNSILLNSFDDFEEDILQRQMTVSLISETWEQASGNKKFEAETERLFELLGLMFVSCPRPSKHRGHKKMFNVKSSTS